MTTAVPHSVTVVLVIAASPAGLYAAWTEPDPMRRWFVTAVDAGLRIGGRVHANGTSPRVGARPDPSL